MEIFSIVLQRTKLLPDPNCSRKATRHYQAVSIYLYIVSNTYGEYLLYMVVPELLVAFSRLLQHTDTVFWVRGMRGGTYFMIKDMQGLKL